MHPQQDKAMMKVESIKSADSFYTSWLSSPATEFQRSAKRTFDQSFLESKFAGITDLEQAVDLVAQQTSMLERMKKIRLS